METIRFIFAALLAGTIVSSCSSNTSVAEDISDDGLLLNDDLVAMRSQDGRVYIKNASTGVVTIKDIKLDWTQRSGNDSLAVFCSEGKRGFYNLYTGEIAVPAQYRRAWVFREGLAAVQRNGNIGFINYKGETVMQPLDDLRFRGRALRGSGHHRQVRSHRQGRELAYTS